MITRKICITGPECSGKTSLMNSLVQHYPDAMGVQEYSRIYLSLLGRQYEKRDLSEIAKGQLMMEDVAIGMFPALLFCDTSMLVIKIWSEYRFGQVDSWIETEFIQRHYDLFLLCMPDLSWEEDPLRENPTDRWRLFELYKEALSTYEKPFSEIGGHPRIRINLALQAIRGE